MDEHGPLAWKHIDLLKLWKMAMFHDVPWCSMSLCWITMNDLHGDLSKNTKVWHHPTAYFHRDILLTAVEAFNIFFIVELTLRIVADGLHFVGNWGDDLGSQMVCASQPIIYIYHFNIICILMYIYWIYWFMRNIFICIKIWFNSICIYTHGVI